MPVPDRDVALSEGRLQALVTASSDVVYQMSADWREMRHLVGREFIASTEDPTESWLQKYIPPEEQAFVLAAIERAIRTKSIFQLKHRVLRVDGSLGWTLSRAVPVRDEHGEIREWIGTATAITSTQESEERRALLMREVDHRAKNVLAVVQSLVKLSYAGSIAELKAALAGRIEAMARVHSLLISSKSSEANLERMIRDETAPFGGRVDITGPSVDVLGNTAQPLGMAIHELTTNAAKYGALSSTEGSIAIGWTIDSATQSLALNWSERGGPAVVKGTGRGFGSVLLQRCIEQFGGRFERTFPRDGLECCIILPANTYRPAPRASQPIAVLPEQTHRKRNVLIVDDEALVALALEQQLTALGHNVVAAVGDVECAVIAARSLDIDLAVLNFDLQGKPATPVATILRERCIPFAWCTGFDQVDDPAPIMRKPLSEHELVSVLASLPHHAAH